MSPTTREVHVYADGEPARLHVVPVVRLTTGVWVEAQPATSLTLAPDRVRATGQLAGLLEGAAVVSAQRAGARAVDEWNGGPLWARNRLFVSVEWHADHIAVMPQRPVESADLPLPQWELESEEDLPLDTAPDAIARTILAYLDRVPA